MSESSQSPDTHDNSPDEFVQLFMADQRRILAYVATLVPNIADAEDIVQEAGTVMWKKFDEFTPGTDFSAWAFRIARLKVLEYRRRHSRQPLLFNDDLMDKIAATAADLTNEIEAQNLALADCIEKLPADTRQLVQQRYMDQAKMDVLAEQFRCSVVTVRKRLRSAHEALFECIENKLSEEGSE